MMSTTKVPQKRRWSELSEKKETGKITCAGTGLQGDGMVRVLCTCGYIVDLLINIAKDTHCPDCGGFIWKEYGT